MGEKSEEDRQGVEQKQIPLFPVPAVRNLLYSISLWSNEWAFDGVSGL